jgi:ATP-binding cassette, subfamily B, bacterial
MIARFYEFQEGKILIDGMDIRSFDLPQYRRQLGIVSQVPFLFNGT